MNTQKKYAHGTKADNFLLSSFYFAQCVKG